MEFANGMALRPKVMRPPPRPCVLSRLRVVYPGSLGVWWCSASFVSSMNGTSILCLRMDLRLFTVLLTDQFTVPLIDLFFFSVTLTITAL